MIRYTCGLWILLSSVSVVGSTDNNQNEYSLSIDELDGNVTDGCNGLDGCEETTLIHHTTNQHMYQSEVPETHLQDDDTQIQPKEGDVGNYVGEWEGNQRHGYGIYNTSLNQYIGTWQNNLRHGTGTEVSPEGKYVGDFQNGQKHGKGTMKWSNGESFWGQWENGIRSGLGIFTLANGGKYLGRWVQGGKSGKGVHVPIHEQAIERIDEMSQGASKYHNNNKALPKRGIGVCEFESGDRYVGEWFAELKHVAPQASDSNPPDNNDDNDDNNNNNNNEKKTATGLCWWEDGVAGKQYGSIRFDGQGVYEWGDGARYAGGFKPQEGKSYSTYNGKGILTKPDGSKYVGEFKDGESHGYGIQVDASGAQSNGFWNNGNLLQ